MWKLPRLQGLDTLLESPFCHTYLHHIHLPQLRPMPWNTEDFMSSKVTRGIIQTLQS